MGACERLYRPQGHFKAGAARRVDKEKGGRFILFVSEIAAAYVAIAASNCVKRMRIGNLQ